MTPWDDPNARARGLATHLLPELFLAELSLAADLRTVAHRLAEAGVNRQEPAAYAPALLNLEVRRWAGRQLKLLGRWLGLRAPLLNFFFED